MPIKPLARDAKETADDYLFNHLDRYCYGVWLPDGDQQGLVQVDAWPGPLGGVNTYTYQISSGAGVYNHSSLQSTMNFLGVQGHNDRRETTNTHSTQYVFPEVGQLAARAAVLNETLPPEHQLPDFGPYTGGRYPARTFLEALARGTVLVATGRNESGQIDNAYSAAHDMAFHVPYWLATTPKIREMVSHRAQQALSETTNEPIQDGQHRNLPTSRVMRDLDIGISALGMFNVVISDQQYGRVNPSFAEAIGVARQNVYPHVKEIREHMQFLDQHITDTGIVA